MDLIQRYKSYIACLNARDLERLDNHVAENAVHNGRNIGLIGYREMLRGNYRDIPDLSFCTDIVANDTTVGSRLRFDCRPAVTFLGLPVNGRRVVFHESVFYRYQSGKISTVWSVIDPTEINSQLMIRNLPILANC